MGVRQAETAESDISEDGYRVLAEFRFRIREFLHFSEESARRQGIEPQQHQLLLALKGLPHHSRPTVSVLALRLCIRHHSAVELINRLAERGAVVRRSSDEDRREVLVEITPKGEKLLEALSRLHWQELETSAPGLAKALDAVMKHGAH